MTFRTSHAAAIAAAVLCACAGSIAATADAPRTPGRNDKTRSVNLDRVRILLDGDVRAIWIGDSWCHLGRTDRLPFGAIAVWPGLHVTAVSAGYKGGGGLCQAENYTRGEGSMTDVNQMNGWCVEADDEDQARFALPLDDLTVLQGLPGLIIPQSGAPAHRLCRLRINSVKWALTDHGPFTLDGDSVRARAWFYAPKDISSQVESIRLSDGLGSYLSFNPETDARAKWSAGADPDEGEPVPPIPSQMNAACFDAPIDPAPDLGPQIVVSEDPAWPIAGSGAWWCFGGATFFKIDGAGRRLPGYHHSGLAQDSWTLTQLGDDLPSDGGRNFTDEQLLHWLDATTLDRAQTPVMILHAATEYWSFDELRPKILRIINRFRAAYGAIGGEPPRFLLVGSYMHHIPTRTIEQSRQGILVTDAVYASLAESEPDCAFFSLYHATDGVFLSSDEHGGPGTQQAARDWLDANGWSTITFGGNTYHLSSAEDDGLDGVVVTDGLHIRSMPGAAFYARLLGDAIAASGCPADFNADGALDTRDVLTFLNAWTTGEPAADFNADGSVNTLDVTAFLNAWNAGC